MIYNDKFNVPNIANVFMNGGTLVCLDSLNDYLLFLRSFTLTALPSL